MKKLLFILFGYMLVTIFMKFRKPLYYMIAYNVLTKKIANRILREMRDNEPMVL
ncbi:MAG: hypothetical protein ACRCWQ_10345 [Bacilli bacterium]